MRRWLTVALLAALLVAVLPQEAWMGNSVWTDHIQDVGVAKRVFLFVGIGSPGQRDWHYFGVDPAKRPPPDATYNAVYEHAYVQFPQAFDDLGGDEGRALLFELGSRAGIAREALTEGSNNIYTRQVIDTGVAREVSFYVWNSGEQAWYYFGVTPSENDYGRNVYIGPVYEVAPVQFPRDFDELGDDADMWVYEAALRAGLAREGIAVE